MSVLFTMLLASTHHAICCQGHRDWLQSCDESPKFRAFRLLRGFKDGMIGSEECASGHFFSHKGICVSSAEGNRFALPLLWMACAAYDCLTSVQAAAEAEAKAKDEAAKVGC